MGSIGAFIDLFRKGVRLREPEGIKNSTVWLGIFTAIVTVANNYGFSASWLNPETLQRAAEFMPSLFALFAVPATLITTRKIGLPFLDPKPMIQPVGGSTIPQYIEPEVYPELPEVRGSFVGSNSTGMQAAQKANSKRIVVVPTSQHGLSYSAAVSSLGDPRVYIARPSWIPERGYLMRLDGDAQINAGELSYLFLYDKLPATNVPWLPSNEDRAARDWFVIDSWDEGAEEYLWPAQPDVGCTVQVTGHSGKMLMEKGYCVRPDGTLTSVNEVKKPQPVSAPELKAPVIHPEAIELIKTFEGVHDGDKNTPLLEPQKDPVGIWTLGYGATTGIDGRPVTEDHPPLTYQQAEELLQRDLKRFSDGVRRLVNIELSERSIGALVSFAYNLGLGAFGKSTLLKQVNRGRFGDVPAQFRRWNKATVGGQKVALKGLTRRRRAESELFKKGFV